MENNSDKNEHTDLGWCQVSKNICNKIGKLKWCVREEEGWIFLADIDTEEFLADNNNYECWPFEKVIEFEPAIIGLSRMPVGTDIQLCKEYTRKGLFGKRDWRIWFADNETGEEIKIKDEDVEYDSNVFLNWTNQK